MWRLWPRRVGVGSFYYQFILMVVVPQCDDCDLAELWQKAIANHCHYFAEKQWIAQIQHRLEIPSVAFELTHQFVKNRVYKFSNFPDQKECLHIISTYTKFDDVLTNTSIFRAYNVHLLFSQNFENFFPTSGRNDPCSAKMCRVWSKSKVPKNPQDGTRKSHQVSKGYPKQPTSY